MIIRWKNDDLSFEGRVISEDTRTYYVNVERKSRLFHFSRYFNRVPGVYRTKEDRDPFIVNSWTNNEFMTVNKADVN